MALYNILPADITQAERDQLLKSMIAPDMTDIEMARRYDTKIAMVFHQPQVLPQVIKQAKARALKQLEHDPYNPHLLNIMLERTMHYTRNETGYASLPSEKIPAEAFREYTRRLVQIAPNNTRHLDLYEAAVTQGMPHHEKFTAQQLFAINRIVLSDHGASALMQHIVSLTGYREWFDEAQLRNIQTDSWPQIIANTDRFGTLVCPTLRSARLFKEAILKLPENSNFRITIVQQIALDKLETEAAEADECLEEWTHSAQALRYDLHPLPGIDAPFPK